MLRYTMAVFADLVLLVCPVWAQSASYHVERMQIQARAFLETLEPLAPVTATSATVEQQLQQSTSNSVWSRQMVTDDVFRVISTGQELGAQLEEATPEKLLSAKASVESLARRLRISTAALSLTPQSRTALDFLMLELEESSKVMDIQRESLLAEKKANRRRAWVGLSAGYGYGYGAPFGWGSYYPYGYGFAPYGGFYGGYGGYGGRVYGIGPRGCR